MRKYIIHILIVSFVFISMSVIHSAEELQIAPRSSNSDLSVSQVSSMPNTSIHEKNDLEDNKWNWIHSKLSRWQPLSVFFSALAGIAIAFIAVFNEWLRKLVIHPKLDIEQGPFYPDAEIVPLTNDNGKFLANACYLEFSVKNKCVVAENVEVFVAKLEMEICGIFRRVDSFYSLNLRWRHYNTIYLPRISPETSRTCTLGRIVDPAGKHLVNDDYPSLKLPSSLSPFRLELAKAPNTRSDLLAPGKYLLYLEIGASNTRHITKRTIELEFGGKWSPKATNDMLSASII